MFCLKHVFGMVQSYYADFSFTIRIDDSFLILISCDSTTYLLLFAYLRQKCVPLFQYYG